MQRLIVALPVAVVLGGGTAIAFFSGGFFDTPRLTAGVVAWALVAVAALVTPTVLPRSTPGRVALAGLAGLTAWTGASIAWAPLSDAATDDLQRLLLYLGGFIAAVAFLRGPAAQRAVEPAIAAGAVVVLGYGLSDRLLPSVIEHDQSSSAFGRLEQPLTYWNGMGAIGAIGFVLCVRLAGDESRSQATRALAAAGAVPLAVGTYLTFSRGALVAALIGCAALVAIVRSRSQLRALALVLGAGAAASVVANALPAVRAYEGDNATSEGLIMLAVLVALAALAALAQVRVRREPRPRAGRDRRRGPGRRRGGACGPGPLARQRDHRCGRGAAGVAETSRYRLLAGRPRIVRGQPARGTGVGRLPRRVAARAGDHRDGARRPLALHRDAGRTRDRGVRACWQRSSAASPPARDARCAGTARRRPARPRAC